MGSGERLLNQMLYGSESLSMVRRKDLKVLGVLLCSLLGLSSGDLFIPHIPEEHISTSLHGSVTLPCSFPFIQSSEGLTVIWEKEENERKLRIYRILNGQENLENQNPRYRGRVELSVDFSQGNLDLTLRDVTRQDEGTYYCRAANQRAPGDKKVTLSIDYSEKKESSNSLTISCAVMGTISIIINFVRLFGYKINLLRKSIKLYSRSHEDLDPNADEESHNLQSGDSVVTRKHVRGSLDAKYEGPYQVLLTAATLGNLEGKPNWIHASHCKPAIVPPAGHQRNMAEAHRDESKESRTGTR